jgi:HK97 gp10 family phage protein
MARISRWRVNEVVEETLTQAMVLLNEAGQVVAIKARAGCPELSDNDTSKYKNMKIYNRAPLSSFNRAFRVSTGRAVEGDIVTRRVSFTAFKGKKKEKAVSFMARTTSGRIRGALKATVRVTERKSKGTVRVYAGNNADVFYGRFVEKGTVNMKAIPFMRPALNSSKGQIRQILRVGQKP